MKASRRVAFTRVDALTDQQRQQQVDALARIGRLRGVIEPRKIKAPGVGCEFELSEAQREAERSMS